MLRIIILLLILGLVMPVPVLADESNAGTIDGYIVNGTAGGDSVSGLNITLKTYLNDSEIASETAITDGNGYFLFDNLNTGPDYNYISTVVFQDAQYDTAPLSFNNDETTKSTEITVYNSTTGDDTISVMMSHTVVYAEQKSFLVKEYFLFVNDSDLTYIGTEERTLRFSLPEGATEVKPTIGLMDCCIVTDKNGFADSMPVLPGAKEIAFSYRLPYRSAEYTLSHKINYPTFNFDLLAQAGGPEVSSKQLNKVEPLTIGGNLFDRYSASQGLVPGEEIVAQLSSGSASKKQGFVIWIVPVLAVLGVAFGLIYVKRRRIQPASREGDLAGVKQKLLIELAKLDDDFDSGKIDESDYRKLREKKKALLAEIMKGEGSEEAA